MYSDTDGKRVLVVEDDPVMRHYLMGVLSTVYNVSQAVNGRDALDMLLSGFECDCVLLDLFMPVLNGFDFLSAIRNNAVLSELPVVVLTADEGAEADAKAAGANEFISKTEKPGVLFLRLHNVFALRDAIISSRTDSLTGLMNRLAINGYCERLIAEDSGEFAVAIFDMDNFKIVNDLMGHAEGDIALRLFASTAKCVIADRGAVGRLGGDEFIAVLKCDNGRETASGVFGTIISRYISENSGKTVRLSCSAGISMYPSDGLTRSALFANADNALYSSKRFGRGQLTFWGRSCDMIRRGSEINNEWLLDELDDYVFIEDCISGDIYYFNRKCRQFITDSSAASGRQLRCGLGIEEICHSKCSQSADGFTVSDVLSRFGSRYLIRKHGIIWNNRKASLVMIAFLPAGL